MSVCMLGAPSPRQGHGVRDSAPGGPAWGVCPSDSLQSPGDPAQGPFSEPFQRLNPRSTPRAPHSPETDPSQPACVLWELLQSQPLFGCPHGRGAQCFSVQKLLCRRLPALVPNRLLLPQSHLPSEVPHSTGVPQAVGGSVLGLAAAEAGTLAARPSCVGEAT